MEKHVNLKEINLSALMLEQMHRVVTWKKANHGIPYGYLLNFVFNNFEVPLRMGAPGTTKKMLTKATLLKCEFLEERLGVYRKFQLLLNSSPLLNEK